jgi:hypothetical protein
MGRRQAGGQGVEWLRPGQRRLRLCFGVSISWLTGYLAAYYGAAGINIYTQCDMIFSDGKLPVILYFIPDFVAICAHCRR